MDHTLAHALNDLLVSHDGIEDPLNLYDGVAPAAFAGLLVVLAGIGLGRRGSGLLATSVAAGASAACALLIGLLITSLVARARPFISDAHIQLLTPHAADPGFPSDHATASFAIATAVWLRYRRAGAIALVAAALLALDRVALGLHWPSDVLGGALLGMGVAAALYVGPLGRTFQRLAGWLTARMPRRPLPSRS